jgi:hypothetical protein
MKNTYLPADNAAVKAGVASRLEDLRNLPLDGQGQPTPAQLAEFILYRIATKVTNATLKANYEKTNNALGKLQKSRDEIAATLLVKFAVNGKLFLSHIANEFSKDSDKRMVNKSIIHATLRSPDLKGIVADLYDRHGYEITDEKSLMDTIISHGDDIIESDRERRRFAKAITWSLITDSAKLFDETEFSYIAQPKAPEATMG